MLLTDLFGCLNLCGGMETICKNQGRGRCWTQLRDGKSTVNEVISAAKEAFDMEEEEISWEPRTETELYPTKSATTLWNCLPIDIRQVSSLFSF